MPEAGGLAEPREPKWFMPRPPVTVRPNVAFPALRRLCRARARSRRTARSTRGRSAARSARGGELRARSQQRHRRPACNRRARYRNLRTPARGRTAVDHRDAAESAGAQREHERQSRAVRSRTGVGVFAEHRRDRIDLEHLHRNVGADPSAGSEAHARRRATRSRARRTAARLRHCDGVLRPRSAARNGNTRCRRSRLPRRAPRRGARAVARRPDRRSRRAARASERAPQRRHAGNRA